MTAASPPVRRVLGTRMIADPLPPRRVTWLASDLHVDHGAGEAGLVQHLGRILAAARRDPASHRVFLLGDLLEFYVDVRQLRQPRDLPGWSMLCRELLHTTQSGVPVAVLWGNRDFLLDPAFARETGCTVVKGGVWLTLAGAPGMLLHGDELCRNDIPYQRSKRFMRNRLVQTVFRTLPLGTRLKVGGGARKESQRSTAQAATAGDQARFDPTHGALDAVFATGVRRLVFGHIHRAARGPWYRTDGTPKGEYLVLPALDVRLAAGGDPLRGCCLRVEEPGTQVEDPGHDDPQGNGSLPPGNGSLVYWDPVAGAPVADPEPASWARHAPAPAAAP